MLYLTPLLRVSVLFAVPLPTIDLTSLRCSKYWESWFIEVFLTLHTFNSNASVRNLNIMMDHPSSLCFNMIINDHYVLTGGQGIVIYSVLWF